VLPFFFRLQLLFLLLLSLLLPLMLLHHLQVLLHCKVLFKLSLPLVIFELLPLLLNQLSLLLLNLFLLLQKIIELDFLHPKVFFLLVNDAIVSEDGFQGRTSLFFRETLGLLLSLPVSLFFLSAPQSLLFLLSFPLLFLLPLSFKSS